MKHLKLILAAFAATMTMQVSADVTFDTDLTSQFSSLTQPAAWSVYGNANSHPGWTATQFCPKVTPNGLSEVQMMENYQTTCNNTGTVFSATVSGLAAGTYRIELYGGAAYTFGRGFTSTAFSEGTWNAGDKIDPTEEVKTGVSLYAQSEGVTYGGEIPIYYATNFPDGAATVTLEGVVVGESGTIKIGMDKSSTSTNWHIIQLKGVTATVSGEALLAAKKAEGETYLDQDMDATVKQNLQNAVNVVSSGFTTKEEYQNAIQAIDDAIAAAQKSIAIYANKAKVEGASATNPIVTDFVVNGTFDSGTTPWQTTTGASNHGTANNQKDAFTGNFYENWNTSAFTGKMYQVIDNIPNGVYKLNICAFVNTFAGEGQETQYVYANNDKTYLTTGTPTAYEVITKVTDNKIEVGFEQTVATANWAGIDNIYLTYYGEDASIDDVKLAAVKEALANAVAAAEALYVQIPVAAKEALEAVVTANNKTYDTTEDYNTAISAINDAITAAQAFVAPYAAFNAMKVYIDALLAVPYEELKEGAHDALSEAVSEEGLETVDDYNNATAKMKNAALTYAANANPTDDNKFDLTFVLSNPDVTSLWTGAWNVRPDGWYNDQTADGQNFQVMANEEMGPGGEVFMEYWSPSPAQDGFVLYQKVTLPEGTYQMTGRVAANFNGQGGTVQNVFFAANDVVGTQITSETLMDAQLDFVQKAEGEVKIGMIATAGNQARWMAINKIQLFKVAPAVIEMKEDVAYTPESAAGTVELTKTFYKGWNTIVLPFGAEVPAQFSALGGELYKYSGYADGSLNFEKADAIAPHTPYLLNIPALPVNEATQTISFEDVTISAGTPASQTHSKWEFVGTYAPLAEGNTVITNTDYMLGETAFLKAKGGNALKAFRAYIQNQGDEYGSKENASKLNIVINGETTSIDAIDGKAISNDAIYNLNGVRMSGKLQKGIYIQNGKKIVVK